MKMENFCYWLQGFFELKQDAHKVGFTPEQAAMIEKHLAMVFVHDIDPKAGSPEEQEKLNKIHDGIKKATELAQHALEKAANPPRRPPPVMRC